MFIIFTVITRFIFYKLLTVKMDKIFRTLLKLSPILNKAIPKSGYVISFQYKMKMGRTVSTYTKLFKDFSMTQDYNGSMTNKNSLLLRLSNTTNTAEIFDLIQENSKVISVNHVLIALNSALSNSRKKIISKRDVTKHKGFYTCCEILQKDMNYIHPTDIVLVCEILHFFQIPVDSFLMETLLMHINKNCNQISFEDAINIHHILRYMPKTDLVSKVIDLLFSFWQEKLKLQTFNYDINTFIKLIELLPTCPSNGVTKLNDLVFHMINESLLHLKAHDAVSIIASLYKLSKDCTDYKPTISSLHHLICEGSRSLKLRDILRLLNTSSGSYYNETTVDIVVNSAISQDMDLLSCLKIQKMLFKKLHLHVQLLDYLVGKSLMDEPESLIINLPHLLIELGMAGYKPAMWEIIQNTMLNENVIKNVIDKQNARFLIDYSINIATLDCYHPALLQKVFKMTHSTNYAMSDGKMLLLYQCVREFYPDYKIPQLESNILENGFCFFKNIKKTSILEILELALGGPQYVHCNLKSKTHHFIDHAIVIRKGGYPIAKNSSDKLIYVESIRLPPESKVILIVNLPEWAYFINTKTIIGFWSLFIRSLEATTGCSVIPINSTMLNNLCEHEKLPYLMQAIRLKCDSDSVTENIR